MKAVVVFLCILAALATFGAQHIDKFLNRPDNAAVAARPAKAPPPPAPVNHAGSRTVTLQSDSRGHFQVDVRIDGRRADFMVDTGASVIALRESSAARLGIHPTPRDYTAKMHTANGIAKAAPVQLNRVELNGITVRDVRAVVMPDESLGENLLGMSFLSRVKWTHERGRLVLEQ